MNNLRLWLRRYFRFSHRETNGFLLLLFISLAAIIIPFLDFNSTEPYNPVREQATLDSLVAHLDTLSVKEEKYKKAYKGFKLISPIKLKAFNPNTATAEELMQLGFSKFAASNIIKYRAKAGNFTYKEQLQRIYGVTSELYSQIETYINLPTSSESKESHKRQQYGSDFPNKKPDYARFPEKYPRKSTKLAVFDLNNADTTELKKIRGIGSKLSLRIIKFRDKLGGFTQQNQLTEVFGLSPEVIDSLRKYTFITASFQPKKVNLNQATFEEMRVHPYIGYNLARIIVAYRTQQGPFKSVKELQEIKQISATQLQKMSPYLSL